MASATCARPSTTGRWLLCALCVDLCPTGSISLSREYVHTCVDADIDSYFILPDANGIHGTPFPKGWAKSADSDLVALERQHMPELRQRFGSTASRKSSPATTPTRPSSRPRAASSAACVTMPARPTCMPRSTSAPSGRGTPRRRCARSIAPTPSPTPAGGSVPTAGETACSVGHRGTPIAIRWLKRYAMDAVPHDRVKEIVAELRPSYLTGKRVAIIGAGPAGLTAAFDLAKAGTRSPSWRRRPRRAV